VVEENREKWALAHNRFNLGAKAPGSFMILSTV